MGEHVEPVGVLPNGLLPSAGPLIRVFDSERWLKAEERTAELIACIQPNQPSEERRNAVADYVQRLISKCFPCQVFTFGSVPLKTYLPDGDIDLTAFSNNQSLKETWANDVRDMLQEEEKNKNAEFHVKEVQYIQAEVKLIKCLVENIVVDISFNQLGGLCTLCFLEEVDHMINQNHLFKRSIILIKAWCYYESRILGAHHGLISTYALETLVLYIFHVYNNPFAGPLEVLYHFLEFFSNYDWENFCVSLWGPVRISSLPNVTAEPPRRDNGELLLNQKFLKSCSSAYAVFPNGQDTQAQPFVSKFFNVIDPLRVNNNLGRSVNKGNFFRIRSAFAFGAKRLARLLDCPQERISFELNQFFLNTWDRHGSGLRPDAPLSENPKKDITNKNLKKNLGSNHPIQRDSKSNVNNNLMNDIQGRFNFARTHSSPELTDTYKYNHNNRKMNSSSPSNEDLPSVRLSNNHHRDEEQEEHNLVNVMASSSSSSSFQGQFHIPMNFPMGYSQQRNFPSNIPLIDPSFSNIQFPNGLVSQPLTHYFSNVGIRANSEESTSTVNENFDQSTNNELWLDQEENGNIDRSSLAGLKYIPPSRATMSTKIQQKYPKRGVDIQSLSSSESLSEKAKEDKRGKKIVPAESSSSVYSKTKTVSDDESETTELPSNRSSNVLPFTFYATGPPVPFVTMLPLYNVPPGSSSSAEEGLDNIPETRQKFDSSDILHSDFLCHWKNLQYGRFCQNVQPQVYPSAPVMVPPNYLQNRVPWDGSGQAVGSNSNLVSQLMSYGPRIVPVTSSRPPNVYQRYVEELPRYRSGTGTYLPNPKVTGRDQHSPNNRRSNYNYEERETNTWNPRNSKTRSSGRNSHNNHNFNEKSSENRSWNSYRPTNLVNSGQTNAAYGVYPAPATASGSNGPNVQSLVMVYPYDNNSGAGPSYGLHPHTPDQLEFGSASRSGLSNDHRFHNASPDQPSSPRHSRRG
jgi:hypothetical protein